jgi:hypothetical protein
MTVKLRYYLIVSLRKSNNGTWIPPDQEELNFEENCNILHRCFAIWAFQARLIQNSIHAKSSLVSPNLVGLLALPNRRALAKFSSRS